MGVGDQRHKPAALTPSKRYVAQLLYRTLGGPEAGQNRCAKSCSYWDSIPVRRGIMNVN
jgi:hypothetical protein